MVKQQHQPDFKSFDPEISNVSDLGYLHQSNLIRFTLPEESGQWNDGNGELKRFTINEKDIDRIYYYYNGINVNDINKNMFLRLIARVNYQQSSSSSSLPLFIELYKYYDYSRHDFYGYIFISRNAQLFMKLCQHHFTELTVKWDLVRENWNLIQRSFGNYDNVNENSFEFQNAKNTYSYFAQ